MVVRVGVGYSLHPSGVRGAQEAAAMAMHRAHLRQADFALVFLTLPHCPDYTQMLLKIRHVTSARHLIGCSALGILTQETEAEWEPAVAVLVLSESVMGVQPFLFPNLEGRCAEAGTALGSLCTRQGSDASLAMILPDTFTFDPDPFFRGLADIVSRPVIGGGCSEDGTRSCTYQFYGEDVTQNALVGATFSGPFTFLTGMTQACHPVGEPMVITRTKGRSLLELGGRKASDVIRDLLQGPVGKNSPKDGGHLFLAYGNHPAVNHLERGAYQVRQITAVDSKTGALSVAADLSEGQVVSLCMRDSIRAQADLQAMLRELREETRSLLPAFGLYFNCCGRGRSLYGSADVDVRTIRSTLGAFPLIGFSTYAEIAPVAGENRLHNYSGVLTLFFPWNTRT